MHLSRLHSFMPERSPKVKKQIPQGRPVPLSTIIYIILSLKEWVNRQSDTESSVSMLGIQAIQQHDLKARTTSVRHDSIQSLV